MSKSKVFTLMSGLMFTATMLSVLLGLLLSVPVMLLWNWCLIPAVPAIKEIGWMQAWGILVLFNIFFKATLTVNKD